MSTSSLGIDRSVPADLADGAASWRRPAWRRGNRKLLIQALCCSLIVHVAEVSALWWSDQSHRDSTVFSGRRDAVYVQVAWSVPPSEPPVEISKRLRDDVVEPQATALSAERTTRDETASVVQRPPMEVPEPVDATGPGNRPSTSDPAPPTDSSIKPARPVPRRMPKVVTRFSPLVVAIIQQQAGTSERESPDLSENRPPPYPLEAIAQRIEGTVLLKLFIDERGNVVDVEVIRSSGHEVLDRAAVQAVRSWRGRPAYRRGKAVSSTETLPIRFRL